MDLQHFMPSERVGHHPKYLRLLRRSTPHNGHSNSFSALLEMLDPQRFTRGVEVRPNDLKPVMVRRLKADLRRLGEAFPERIIEAVSLAGLPEDLPELDLARRLAAKTPGEQVAALTPLEIEVLNLMAEGASNKTIARRLGISVHTVKFHVGSLLDKLDAAGRTGCRGFVGGARNLGLL
jgi:DNA-binding CsgD family transcriptional regulator